MKKSKTQKGITLIALIIIIVVLLILAAVTINAIQGDGIIQYASNAADEYTKKVDEEKDTIDTLFNQIGESINKESAGEGEKTSSPTTPATTIEEAIEDDMLTKKVNSEITDIYGNKIVVPEGFKILVDSTTVYTEEDISVTKGVVIQDKDGNEFVWVPVGTIYTNTAKTESKTITLGRYSNFTKNANGEYIPAQTAENYATQIKISSCTEETLDGEYENAIAKDIGAFCINSIANGGYYIGRYEAGDLESTNANAARTSSTSDENTVVCKANQRVYNYVKQSQASSLSQNMYKDALNFTSDLINSYAWDTAIIFIKTFGKGNENYYSSLYPTKVFLDGCNIYDMGGNALEWSSETCEASDYPVVPRGGFYCDHEEGTGSDITSRFGYWYKAGSASEYITFRTVLYL